MGDSNGITYKKLKPQGETYDRGNDYLSEMPGRDQANRIACGADHRVRDKEKKAIMKQWAKREEQIERVMQSTVGMYGDLQGIAGKTLQEIEGLELKVLEVSTRIDVMLGKGGET